MNQVAFEGARPIVHYGREGAAAERLLEQIAASLAVRADLSEPSGAFTLWSRAFEAAGRIHALLNNAGIRTEISIDSELRAWQQEWLRDFQANFLAAADLCREAIRHFRTRTGGHIINMASRAGLRSYLADAMPYGATKAAT